ncbi:MAG: hypothetical protein V7K92_21560 [Nostoc sp.]
MEYDSSAIIDLMNDALTENSFNQLVVGRFSSVKKEFKATDALSYKILTLVEYVATNQNIPQYS